MTEAKKLILLHVVFLIAALAIGCFGNSYIGKILEGYAGFFAVASTAFAIYSFLFNVAYNRNPKVYFYVQRLRALALQNYTYCKPYFRYTLEYQEYITNEEILDRIIDSFENQQSLRVRIIRKSDISIMVIVDEEFYFVIKVDERSVNCTLDRKVCIPTRLLKYHSDMWARVNALISNVVSPKSVLMDLEITYSHGESNPYLGYFVRSIPKSSIKNFDAIFEYGERGRSTVEATIDRVIVVSSNPVDYFDAISKVMALEASPKGSNAE